MKDFEQIEDGVKEEFGLFLHSLLEKGEQPMKYYYWSIDFFETVGSLSFNYFSLSGDQKKKINEEGKQYFETSDIYFEVNENSHRHDLYINNFHKLFNEKNKAGQTNRYEYLKEYVFWDILKNIQKSLDENERTIFGEQVKKQRKNFLITYLGYLIEHTKSAGLTNFTKYTRTQQGEDLDKKLKELDDKDFDNEELKNRVEKLFIRKGYENKIHFIFSRSGGGGKEELRELLDVMGRDDSGKLYRGQASSTWKLDSSLTREPKYLECEGEMYYEILSLKPDAFSNDPSVYERLITMQHFGMPTRLMDITRNPLVAIFFACNNMENAQNDGVVFCFKPGNDEWLNFEDPKLEQLKELYDNGTKPKTEFLSKISFLKGLAKNPRISNQSGDFIFVGDGDSIKKDLDDLPALTIIIDKETKKVLLEQLESLNIHGGAVYPDLTNLSNYIKNKYAKENREVIIKAASLGSFGLGGVTLGAKVVKKEKEDPQAKLIEDFDEIRFWDSKTRRDLLTTFAEGENIFEDKLRHLISDYLFTGKEPLSYQIQETMKEKPPLKLLKKATSQLKTKIMKFTKTLIKAE